MQAGYTEGKTFEKVDFTQQLLPAGAYENCQFIHCNFTGVHLSGLRISDCTFTGCNLSMTRLIQTSIRNTPFKDCKCVGLQFQKVTEVIIGITFDTCLLNLASFYKLKLKKAQFLNTNLHEVDFTETDLTLALFENCDLARATFDNTLLEGADLRTAYNYTIDPVRNKIRGARFSLPAVVGLLGAYDIEIT